MPQELLFIARDNARRLLTSVLKSVKPKVGELGGLWVIPDSEHSAHLLGMDLQGVSVKIMLKMGACPPTYGGAAALNPEAQPTSSDDDRFSDRARALFYARLAFLGIGLAVLASPSWSAFLGITSTKAFIVYFMVIAYSVANFLLIEHPRLGRPLTLVTLLLDLATLGSVVMPSGGLKSPLMAAHVMLTIFLVLLFPRLLAIVPGLVLLPVVAQLNLVFQGVVFSQGLFLIVWYATLSLIAAYVLLYLNKRDEKRRHQLQMLSKSQESAIITEERLRLAREIHDGLGGELSTLIMKAEFAQRIAKDPELKKEITDVKEQAEEAIEELRRSLTMMRRDFNLHKALEDYCMRFQERSRTWCVLKVRGRVRRLPSEMQLAVFRILQETLTNIQKARRGQEHRGAPQVRWGYGLADRAGRWCRF